MWGDTRKLLRRLSRTLAPVVVVGSAEPHLLTHVTNVTRLGAETFVHLGPIDTERVQEGRAVIRSLDVNEPFEIVVDGLRINARGEAVAPISAARTEVLSSRVKARKTLSATRPLALMVHGDIEGTDANIFPITDISDESCCIETTFAMAPGLELARVELVGERRTLRRGRATVIGFTSRRLPSGSLRFLEHPAVSKQKKWTARNRKVTAGD